jgi:NitT/TauT family transport system permease protein
MLVGYILAVLAGLGIGALLGQSSILEDMFSPILSLMMAIPTIAWVPVLLITMGLGEETVITAIFLGGFFAIAYNTMAGMRSVDKNLIDAGRNCGLNKFQMFSEVYVPGSMVYILTGLRLGIGYSWRALVGAEMLAPLIMRGLGKMIYDARFWNDISAMLVALIMIGLVGYILDKIIIGKIEKMTIKKWGMVKER